MSGKHARGNSSGSGRHAAPHANREDPTPDLKAGVNPLYGSEIVGGEPCLPPEAMGSSTEQREQQDSSVAAKTATAVLSTNTKNIGPAPGARDVTVQMRRAPSSQRKRPSARGGSPQSTLTTSTTQSSTSSRRAGRPAAPPSQVTVSEIKGDIRSEPTSRSSSAGKLSKEPGPAPLVPANLAPVPPAPRKRKSATTGDIETGEATVLEDAPDKTLMEMLQSYLKKQDLYTRIVLVVVLLILAGGVLGAYVVMIIYAIRNQSVKYITLCVVFSVFLTWVLYKYCFSDDKLQDQSAIAQDIAQLYAAIPDHTAVRGVSEKGRAQFTDFKYEKAEMMFTAVTDDGVSLGSERGSELMMDGADPSCPLCNVAYEEGAELCLLPCLHVFHKKCINKWCNRHIVCPLCKRHLEAPEPLHNLSVHSAAGVVQSEPGGHGAHGANQPRAAWRHMLGNGAPGPASGHGSSRGLGGTRSDDGQWNDRVLNAAQRQQSAHGGHNRVTSFSSETRRQNAVARGRSGPPQSSSAGASTGRGAQRSQSVSGSTGRHQQRVQRKRSSSFTTANERGRGSGPVAHGTAPNRGGPGSFRGGESTSPRSRSDLGVGSREAERARASDAMLSRHATRLSSGSGGTRMPSKSGDDGSGALSEGGAVGRPKREGRRKMTVVTVTSQKTSQKGVHSRGQGPAVITVRKVSAGPKGTQTKVATARSSRVAQATGARDAARSGGESESEHGVGERVFKTNSSRGNEKIDQTSPSKMTTKALSYGPRKVQVTSRERSSSREVPGAGHRRQSSAGSTHEEDSPEEVTTKALTYEPRKPRASRDGPGHRRQSSTGSTSAEESSSAKKTRRRRSIPGSRSGSGNQTAVSTAAATAEAVAKLLSRPQQEERPSSASSRASGRPAASAGSGGAIDPCGHSSGGESGSDGRGADVGRRGSRGSSRTVNMRRNTHPQPVKTTPTKTAPMTKGTPAPPMAAARTWNSNMSASTPMIDPAFSPSDADRGQVETGEAGAATASAAAAESFSNDANSSPETNKRGSSRSWSIHIPSSAGGSSEFFGLSGGNGSGNAGSTSTASVETPADVEQQPQSSTKGSSSLASKVFSRSSGPGKLGSNGGRLFGSNTAARIGMATGGAGYPTDSEDERNTEPLSESAGRVVVRKTSSVKELIQTYEKVRSSSDEKAPAEELVKRARPTPGQKKRSSKTFARRRGSSASANSMSDLVATESEQDDDHINRPKLSYKKKGARHSRTRTPSEGAPAQVTNPIQDQDGLGDGASQEAPVGDRDGDEGADDERYTRPKLSYGGRRLSASRKAALVGDSAPVASS